MNGKILSFSFVLMALLLASCNSYKNVGYLKGVEDLSPEQLAQVKPLAPKILPNDWLTITVNTVNPVVAAPFNMPLVPMINESLGISSANQTVGMQTYIVGKDEMINFPVLGKIQAGGKTVSELEEIIQNGIFPKYITEMPIVTVRFTNYKVSVLGEVQKPGVYAFPTEHVNLFEALAMASDLTIYGRRDNVLLKREHADGTNEYVRLNLQDKNLVLSPYFYLQQNDVIYVEPNKAKGNSSSIGSTENLTISVVSVLVSVATLLVTVFR